MKQFAVRPASVDDAQALAKLFAAVAEERDGIATEPPVNIDERAAQFARTIAGSVVAVADGQLIGMLHVEGSRHGFGEIGMLVDRGWRGCGVGSALMQAAIDLGREHGLHKLCLEVFAHNAGAIALYRKCGFVEEGRRPRQYRRASGELWDSIVMGLALLTPWRTAAGSAFCPRPDPTRAIRVTKDHLEVTLCGAKGAGAVGGTIARNGVRSRRYSGAAARRVPSRAPRPASDRLLPA